MMNHHIRPLIGWSDAMQDLRAHILRMAPTDMTLMIRGERGTGKELVAGELHLKSNRATGPFIRLNCAGLPETLVESELFGCEKGAFTGAEFRKGRFEQADGGTLMLDEVGDLSITAQPKLLRVLETREVDRVGGRRPIPVDFRLIVATNRNLEEMARTAKFREDLYDRLNMDIIHTPPLRDRLDDIPVLAEYFIGEYVPKARRQVTGVSQPVLDLLQKYWWPGNIRELENVIRRAVFTGQTELIRLEDLPFDFAAKSAAAPVTVGNYHERMQEFSRQLVQSALMHCRGNRRKAAMLLGLSKAQLYKLAKMRGLDGEPGDIDPKQDPAARELGWV
jgi:transcriptional regulator with PAS, ATPase and Fis domain